MKLRKPDITQIFTENGNLFVNDDVTVNGIKVTTEICDGEMHLYVAAESTPIRFIRLRFNFGSEKRKESVKILGDDYERSYGTLHFSGIEPDRVLPWYMLVSNGSDTNPDYSDRFTEGFGVKVQPNSIVTWRYDANGVTMWADIRNGGNGIVLNGRQLLVCKIVFCEYRNMSAFEAGKRFCKEMSPYPKLPIHQVYGSNNYYYAYGDSSDEAIIEDSKVISGLSAGIENRPYMVIDGGWNENFPARPDLLEKGFHNMNTLATEMRKQNIRPGIWVRYLFNENRFLDDKPDWLMAKDKKHLDPSNPEVLEYIKEANKTIRKWGYELIKHDFSTYDILSNWGCFMSRQMASDGWNFYDKSKTTAEIIVNFYKVIRESAGDDCIIIGCNTIPHLCAGIFELNRTGDDTSGLTWTRTRKMGVNTLAFRLIQNGSFYMNDADCVGITEKIPWNFNRQWLDLLSRSGTPLFVSPKPTEAEKYEIRKDLIDALKINSVQHNECRPLDWMENELPQRWLIDGKEVIYNWFDDNGTDFFTE